jgi:uncharacterized protein YecE (DUF72 family)
VLLVQLPPGLSRDDIRLAYFLQRIPEWLRVAVEFRHPGWHCEEVFALLEEHRAAYCVTSGANLPCVLRATADFVYVRILQALVLPVGARLPDARSAAASTVLSQGGNYKPVR